MADLDLTPLEKQILETSARPDITIRRKRIAIISAFLLVAATAGAALLSVSRTFFIAVLVVYVLITLGEKIAYANAVLAYKSLIRKLRARIEASN